MTEGERRTWRQIVDASYSDEVERFYEQHQSLLDESLDPRGPALFFDLAAEWGLDASSHALDVGSRDGRHLASVSSRFGCRVTGVEPAEGNLARMGRRGGGAPPHPVARGVAEALPFADATFDLAWARDVLVHVEPLAVAFAECRRVLRPGARGDDLQRHLVPRAGARVGVPGGGDDLRADQQRSPPERGRCRCAPTPGHQPALARAVENATTIVVADIAGRQGGRSALGSSLIVDPDGVVLAGAEPDGEALLVAEVEAARRAIGPRGRDGHRNPAVTEAFTALWRPDAV